MDTGEPEGRVGFLSHPLCATQTSQLQLAKWPQDKCDIWSLGVVFLELLTGEPAFHRDAGQCDGYTAASAAS